ncbi:hypothetical protein [Frankia sp. Cr1]|uniref:hypothetical protein n=1 Tax=Frankia sp. Cr1 TaxID=3073931 RepID=UPI002AD5670A|nr:hypothetical protein [Frankia sp. Cr1]
MYVLLADGSVGRPGAVTQNRADQNRADQNRADQNRADQNRADRAPAVEGCGGG